MQAHTHGYSYKGLLNKQEGAAGFTAASIDFVNGTTGSTGGGDSQNLQPYSIARTIIKT